jgi:PAS domain S-box-containing protein
MNRKTFFHSLVYSLFVVFFGSLLIMTVFEYFKQIMSPNITIWGSHILTIVFTSCLATIGAYFTYQSLNEAHRIANRETNERRRAEEELREAQEKYSKGFLASPDAIVISDLDTGEIVEVNDATMKIFGYSREEMIGKTALDLGMWLRSEDREKFVDAMKTKGHVRDYDLVERRKSGTLFNATISADTLEMNDKIHLISVIRDSTGVKELEREAVYHAQELMKYSQSLATTIKKLNILSSITRHDINNQLTVLLGYLTIVESEPDNSAGLADIRKAILAARNISEMIQFTKRYEQIGVNSPIWQNLHESVEDTI